MTFILAAFCPFTINYSAVLLTEIVTIFLMIAMMLAATYAIKAKSLSRADFFWVLAGVLGGAVVDVRPDSGLFALGLGVTLVIAAFARTEIRKAFVADARHGNGFCT